jgi:hypothetical protein
MVYLFALGILRIPTVDTLSAIRIGVFREGKSGRSCSRISFFPDSSNPGQEFQCRPVLASESAFTEKGLSPNRYLILSTNSKNLTRACATAASAQNSSKRPGSSYIAIFLECSAGGLSS